VRLVGPRSSWRRAHFWLGVAATIYIVLVGVTGSSIVFEQELYRFLSPDPPLSAATGARLDDGALKSAIAFHFPNRIVIGLWDRRLTDGMAVEVWLHGSNGTLRRLIHPSTGEDLGDAQPAALRLLAFLRRAHVAALAGSSGRIINATGALTLIALSISGLAARRHLPAISGRKKSALTFHRIVGTVGSFFGILWGVTGVSLVFPTTFVGVLGAANEPLFEWMYVLHTGSAGGLATRILWASAALALVLAAVTGARLWWRRTKINARSPSERGNSLPAPSWRHRPSIASALRRRPHPMAAVCDPASPSCGPPPPTVPPSPDRPSL
jgi:uncharacterized iron-regulated membrane protein